MYALTRHHAAVDDEGKGDGVEFQSRAGKPCSKRKILENPPLRNKVGHDGVESEASWNGRALEVFALASCILGEGRDGDIEASEASKATENEEGEASVVDNSA